jgi:hypothetical protein
VEDGEPREARHEDEESLARAADADETLPPGSEPGEPDYPEEATEGRDAGGGAPAH